MAHLTRHMRTQRHMCTDVTPGPKRHNKHTPPLGGVRCVRPDRSLDDCG